MIDYRLPLDELPDPLPIEPLRKPFDVSITPPGSKSITCRAYVLAALANGESRIIRPLRAEDTDGLLKALCTLGATAKWEGEDVLITGVNGRFPRGGEVNLGDGGTPTRFMIACACLAKEPVVVDGSPRMRERPIAEGVDLLRQFGATIEYVERGGRLPVRITPSDEFKGGELAVGRTASSQFISALLLIAPWIERGVKVRFTESPTSITYINLTLDALGDWKVMFRSRLREETRDCSVELSDVVGQSFRVEPDASSAAYWIVAAAINESRASAPHIPFHSQQPDVQVARHLQPEVFNWRQAGLWASDVRWPINGSILAPLDVDAREFPDGALALCIAAVCSTGRSTISGLHTLRVKETDRVAALANELTKVGCRVEIDETDGDVALVIHPIPRDANGNLTAVDPMEIETYNDHRMAMAFAVLGLVRPGLSIRNPACVAKSYPGFWRDFAKLYDG